MKIALFLPNWVGDAVMATPALRALRRRYPRAEIVGVLRPYVADVLAGLDLVDRILIHEPHGTNPTSRGTRFIDRLRAERFDLGVLFPNSLRSAFIAWRARITRRIGFARDARRWLLTDPLMPKSRSTPNPVIDEYLRLAAHVGCTALSRKMELATLPEDERRLDDFWDAQEVGLRDRGVVCLNPGGAFGLAKHWPAEYFGILARDIAKKLEKTVLVLCGPAEREIARAIARQAAHPHVVSLADAELSLGLTKAAVKSARLLVTTDSGPRHFAPPFDVPVITLFGPTHIAWSETFAPNAVHLQKQVDCGPCQERTCPLKHHRCMRELSVNEVFSAVVALLERTAKPRRVAA